MKEPVYSQEPKAKIPFTITLNVDDSERKINFLLVDAVFVVVVFNFIVCTALENFFGKLNRQNVRVIFVYFHNEYGL